MEHFLIYYLIGFPPQTLSKQHKYYSYSVDEETEVQKSALIVPQLQ